MASADLISLTTELADPKVRTCAKREVASKLGVREILIFIMDPALDILLPAPGFPQTIPEGGNWLAFAESCARQGSSTGTLPSPDTGAPQRVLGRSSSDGSVIALIGAESEPDAEALEQFLLLMPLLAMSLKAERSVLTAQGQAQAIRESAIRAHEQAISLETARAELAESQIRFRFALNAARMGDWDFDLKAGVSVRSLGHARCFGYENIPEKWCFEDFLAHVHPDDRESVRNSWLAAIEGKSPYEVEFRVVWPDGSVHWLSSKGRVLRNALGASEHFVGVVMEITAQKEMEWTLRNAISMRDEFLSIASHELRTPVTSMKLQVQLARRAIDKGDPTAFSVDKITKLVRQTERGLDRLSRLINDMLDISRIQSGKLSILRAELDLTGAVRDTLERFQSQLESASILATLSAQGECWVLADPLRMDQMIENFITNAIRYAPNGSLEVGLARVADEVVMTFKDSGPGIAEKDQARIFERFERLISASEVSGLGLGLYIVKQVVEMHGGAVEVRSELGKGTEFVVRLPAIRSPR